jgi:hypothetical protein
MMGRPSFPLPGVGEYILKNGQHVRVLGIGQYIGQYHLQRWIIYHDVADAETLLLISPTRWAEMARETLLPLESRFQRTL